MSAEAVSEIIWETVSIADLKPHPRNYRAHPADQLEHIAASLEEHGQYRNVVVANDLTILAGHGVVEAAVKNLGWTELRVGRVDVEPFSATALKILTGDNEIGRLAEIDDRLLAAHLKELAEFDSLLGTGFDSSAFDVLLAQLAEENAQLPGQSPLIRDGQREHRDPRMREVVLVYSDAQFAEFELWAGIVGRETGIAGISEIVYATIRGAATGD